MTNPAARVIIPNENKQTDSFSPPGAGFAVNIGSVIFICADSERMRCVRFFNISEPMQYKEGFTIAKNDLQINEMIRDTELRVISADGEQLGVMDARAAQQIANEKGLDLVKIAPTAKPPVCKIMDYGKYKFELAKREKENRKNQKVINIKEVQLSPSIDTNDFNTKAKQAMKFLKSGDKVRVKVRFRGRELSHSEIGKTLLDRFAETVQEFGNVEKPAKLEGRNMIMFLAPVTQ